MKSKKPINGKTTPDWERLYQVIKHSGMSVNAFALHIGLPRSENLYQIKKGNHGISKALAEQIHKFFPDYSLAWLLTGKMTPTFLDTPNEIHLKDTVLRRIPVYHDFHPKANPIHHTFLPEEYLNGAEMIVLNKDETLSPKIPAGSLVMMKPVKNILPGRYYLIVTEEFTMIRKVAVFNKPDEVIFCTTDPQGYNDFALNRSEIIGVYTIEKIIAEP